MTPLVDARGVSIGGRLDPTDLQATASEMIAVIGPNGAGKTSLLRALAGIELDAGEVAVDGKDLASAPPAQRMRLLSFLPASRALVWPISARDVIALGLPSPDPGRIEELIGLMQLDDLAGRPADRLSTGERSRVLLARALAARPRLLLLDEPLSNLEPYWVITTLRILRDVARREGCAVIASLHDLAQLEAFDRALLVHEGRIAADGNPGAVLDTNTFPRAFRVERSGSGWRISAPFRPEADPRSSR